MSSPDAAFPSGQRMLVRIQGFLERLREDGMAVGVAAGVDLGQALQFLPSLERETFRAACRVTLAKSPADLERVDRVFDEYWLATVPIPVPPPADRARRGSPRERRGTPSPPPPRAPPPGEERTRELLQGRYSPQAPAASNPLPLLPEPTVRRLRHAARRFRRQVATLPGRRWERASGGMVDLRRTARRGLHSAGEWVELLRRDRAPRRADLVILWDVSGSMREHSGELFALVHALHRTVRRSRVFAFGHELEEITPALRGCSYDRSRPEVARRITGAGGGTQIAHCLGEFRRSWSDLVRPTTTVVIVSDGWDLGQTPELDHELALLRRSAGRLVWVNPYAADAGFAPETAALRAALPHLDLLTSATEFPRAFVPRRARRGAPARS